MMRRPPSLSSSPRERRLATALFTLFLAAPALLAGCAEGIALGDADAGTSPPGRDPQDTGGRPPRPDDPDTSDPADVEEPNGDTGPAPNDGGLDTSLPETTPPDDAGPETTPPVDTGLGEPDTAAPPDDAVDPPDSTISPDTTSPPDTGTDTGTEPTVDTGPEPDTSEPPVECPATPCTTAGTSCVEADRQVCTADAEGCLTATMTPCGDPGCNAATGECNPPTGGFCGDGIVQAGEECDDGNGDVDDGCTPDCMTERPYVCANNAGYISCNETWNFNTTGSSAWGGYPCNGFNYNGHDMILYLRPPRSGTVTLRTNVESASGTSDWDLMVLDGDSAPQCGPGVTCVAQGISGANNETVSFSAVAGKLYLVVIDGNLSIISSRQGARGTLQVTCP